MNRLDESVRAALSKTVLDKLQKVFADMAEEEKALQQAMRVTLDKLMEEIQKMEASMERQKENWERERENLVQSADAARQEEWLKKRDDISRMQFRLNVAMKDREKERENHVAVEQEHKHILSLLKVTLKQKMKAREEDRAMKDAATQDLLSRERENDALPVVLAAAATKQMLLKELKDKNMATVEANSSQQKLLDNWRKLQDSKPCPSDQLQVPVHTAVLEKLNLKH